MTSAFQSGQFHPDEQSLFTAMADPPDSGVAAEIAVTEQMNADAGGTPEDS